jgi:eukaryotic-like serine/threonine-protein kinase
MTTPAVEKTLQWDTMAKVMEDFLAAWAAQESAPKIVDFIGTQSYEFRAVAVAELIKIDMKQRFSMGCVKTLEEYSQEHPELLHEGEPPSDLIFEEFHLRKMHGKNPQPADYFQRFPKNAATLKRLFSGLAHDCSTSLAANLPPSDFQAGDKIDEFVLITKLGAGAFANVYLARQQSMQRMVALKISANTGNEAETLAQLDHPNIIRVFDQRRLLDRKMRLLYMQYAPGGTLKEVIDVVRTTPRAQRTGAMLLKAVDAALEKAGYPAMESSSQRRRLSNTPWPEIVCRIGSQLALALEFAHSKGVLHRDVKPANVLLTAEGTPKLADFNISFASQLAGITAEAFFGGSLAYMSPEQLEAFNPEHDRRADTLDGRADLFSLGALLWELLHGARPFDEQNLSQRWTQMLAQLVERRRLQSPQANLAELDPATRELTQLLLRVLQPDRNHRPTSGAKFAQELILCLHPRTRKLMEIPQAGWRRVALAWPLCTLIAFALLPNAIAGATNYSYNRSAVAAIHTDYLGSFGIVSFALNVVYFSLGAIIAKWILGPVAAAVRGIQQGTKLSPELSQRLRLRTLRFGSIVGMVGILLWFSSGLVFPIAIRMLSPDFPTAGFRPFFASMPICGLIAAAYPFFGVNYLVVQVLYPALLRAAPGTDADEYQLKRLSRGLAPYLLAAGIVPLLIMLLVVMMNFSNRIVSAAIILAGLAGLAISYILYQRIREDIAALLVAVRPFDADQLERESEAL